MTFVRCESLVKIYKVADLEVFALQGLDLEVSSGEMLAIIGNSGSGKSTLLNILGGLDIPSAGRCVVGESDLLRLNERQRADYRRTGVGFVWQNNARNLIPYLTALENVMLPMQIAGQPRATAHTRALELLDAVGLGGRTDRQLVALSGGEQQRVAIALALANRPRLLLADEPTGSVDNQTGRRILEVLRNIQQQWGTTIIMVTHDTTLAQTVDRYVWIRDGKIAREAVRRVDAVTLDMTHEELAVLDRAGRLQIPPELLQLAGLKDRVRVELEGRRIIVTQP